MEEKLLKLNQITENDWPNWSIGKGSNPLLTIEGQHIQKIFTKIQTQLVRNKHN